MTGVVGELHATFVGNYGVRSACIRSAFGVRSECEESVPGMSGTICRLACARACDLSVVGGRALAGWHTLEA